MSHAKTRMFHRPEGSEEERGFTLLEILIAMTVLAVAGVGPRIALAVLSAMTPSDLADAIETEDSSRLQRTPGVGRRTAERILLELKGRLTTTGELRSDLSADAVSALVNLGYPQREAERAVDELVDPGDERDLAEVIRLALQRLSR